MEDNEEDLLIWLQQINGVEIATLDNPGWYFIFEMMKNPDQNFMQFEEIIVNNSETDWYQCWIKDKEFHGAGGPYNLVDIIKLFKKWYQNIL